MNSYDVIRQAVREPGTKAVAAAMKVSPALVYKWSQPPAEQDDPDQSGARNPLDRVRDLYLLTKDIGLIRYLCNAAGGYFVPNPPAVLPTNKVESVFVHTRKLIREFSDLLDSVTDSVDDDDHIDADEANLIRSRWEDLKSSAEAFVAAAEAGHYHVKPNNPPAVKAASKSLR